MVPKVRGFLLPVHHGRTATWEPRSDLWPTGQSLSPWKQFQSHHVKVSSSHGFKVHSVSEPRPSCRSQCVSSGGGGASSRGQSGWLADSLCGSWRVIGQKVHQSLSEPTADEPFLFLFGALGFESSSSWNARYDHHHHHQYYYIIIIISIIITSSSEFYFLLPHPSESRSVS